MLAVWLSVCSSGIVDLYEKRTRLELPRLLLLKMISRVRRLRKATKHQEDHPRNRRPKQASRASHAWSLLTARLEVEHQRMVIRGLDGNSAVHVFKLQGSANICMNLNIMNRKTMNAKRLRCCLHRATLLGSMRLLIDHLLGQLHQLLSKLHVIRLGAALLGDLGRRNYRGYQQDFIETMHKYQTYCTDHCPCMLSRHTCC